MSIRLPRVFNGRPLHNVRIPQKAPVVKPEKVLVIAPPEEIIQVLPPLPSEEITLVSQEEPVVVALESETKTKSEISVLGKVAALKALLDLGLMADSSMKKADLVGMLLKHHGLD